jgi:hypothetical protein
LLAALGFERKLLKLTQREVIGLQLCVALHETLPNVSLRDASVHSRKP